MANTADQLANFVLLLIDVQKQEVNIGLGDSLAHAL
jgi:hypothetical protein